MQITLAILALAMSLGFAFWVAVMAYLMAISEKARWLEPTALICFAVATVALAFMAGRVWP